MGKLLRGIVSVGKTVSPKLMGLIDVVTGEEDLDPIEYQLAQEGFDENELKFLLAEMEKDREEIRAITERWVSDNKSGSWLARNVRPATLVLYNVAAVTYIGLDSWLEGFEVAEKWMTLLLTNTGMVNTAYFGSRYLEKRDDKKR